MAPSPATGNFAAVVRREWLRLRGDPWDLAMLTWIPLLTCGLMWWIFSSGIPRNLPLVVIDTDHSQLSRTFIRMLDESPGIAVLTAAPTEDAAFHLIRMRRAFGIVYLPRHMQRDVLGGRSAIIQWSFNAQFSSYTGTMTRDVRAVASTLSAGIEMAARQKRGMAPDQALQQVEPIRVRLATLFNENSNYEPFLGLATIPAMLQIFIALSAISAIGRELRAGTVPQWLESAGGRWPAALLGKLAIPAASFGAQGMLFVIFFAGIRGWRIEGSEIMVITGMLLLVSSCLALGTLLIGATLALRNALSLAAFITAPAFAYSGQGFPLIAMPPFARAWAEVLPLTHYLQLQSRTWLAGAPWPYGVSQVLVLAGLTAGFGLSGFLLLRRRALNPERWART
jgi:ABC-2 type transport system permease protein